MADGYLNFDTKINESGFNKGISNLSKIATTGLGVAVGNAITKVVDKVGSIGTAAVKVGMNFEAEMSKVASISGATGDEFQKLIADCFWIESFGFYPFCRRSGKSFIKC